jgi:hypothetical protein
MDASNTDLPAIVEPTPILLIQQALEAKIPASELKELFDLQVRHEQRRAEEAYADAITAFQAECPAIQNNKAVNGKDGRERYRYAPFEEIMRCIMPYLRKHRIVVTFDTGSEAGQTQVTARVRVGVVEKHTTVTLPAPEANQLMNVTQASVGAISYGKRTALVAALNLVCTDEDVSGEQEDPESLFINAEQEQALGKRMDEAEKALGKKCDDSKFLGVFRTADNQPVRVMSQLTVGQWRKAMKDLEIKIAKARKAGAV